MGNIFLIEKIFYINKLVLYCLDGIYIWGLFEWYNIEFFWICCVFFDIFVLIFDLSEFYIYNIY